MTDKEPTSQGHCRECAAPLPGRYCSACGTDSGWSPGPFREAISDVREEFFALDIRFLRTIGALIRRPGFLSAQFLAGKRKRFTSPIRLYLLLALVAALATRGFSPAMEPGPVAEALSGAHFLYAVIVIIIDDPAVTEGNQAAYDLAGTLGHWVGLLIFAPLLALAISRAIRQPPRFFVEHLMVALHFQCFVLIVVAVEGVLLRLFPGSAVASVVYGGATGLAVLIYLLALLRSFYQLSPIGVVGRGFEVGVYFLAGLAAVALAMFGTIVGIQSVVGI